MIVVKAKGHGGPRVFYDRHRKTASRSYHVFGLARVVTRQGESFYRLIVGPWAIAFGYRSK